MGRPSKGVSEKYIGVRLPEMFYEYLRKEAEETDRPLAEVVREMIGAFALPGMGAHVFMRADNVEEAENVLNELKRIEDSLEEAMRLGKSNLSDIEQRLRMVRASIEKVEEVAEKEKKKVLK